MTESPPRDLLDAGLGLWSDVTSRFELDSAELAILKEAARTLDQLDELAVVAREVGPMNNGGRGTRIHPAVAEARAQRLVMARLIAALRLPSEDDEPANRPQRRGAPRGVYSVGGGDAS